MWNRYRQQIEVPAYEEKKVEQLVKEAKKIEYSQKKLRMTTREFFWNQLKFIRPGVWGMKIALILVMFLFLFLENIDGRHWIVFHIRSIAEFDRRSGIVRFVQSRNERTFVDCEKVFGSSVGCQASGVLEF